MHDGTDVATFQGFLIVAVHHDHEHESIKTHGRFDDIRDVFLVGLRIKVGHILFAVFLVALQIVVGSVGDTEDFSPTEIREIIFDVSRGFGVESKLGWLMIAEAKVFGFWSKAFDEFEAVILPVSEPFKVGSWLAEEFHLHLIELADTESEVPWGDFVTEALTSLANTEWELLSLGALDVLEVNEDALSGLWTEVDDAAAIIGNADVGLEHHVELTDWGEISLSADWALNVMLFDEFIHLLEGHVIDIGIWEFGFDEFIGTVTGFASLAVDHWIVEGRDVTGGFPNAWVHKDAGIDADVGWGFLNESLPPCLTDVLLELSA